MGELFPSVTKHHMSSLRLGKHHRSGTCQGHEGRGPDPVQSQKSLETPWFPAPQSTREGLSAPALIARKQPERAGPNQQPGAPVVKPRGQSNAGRPSCYPPRDRGWGCSWGGVLPSPCTRPPESISRHDLGSLRRLCTGLLCLSSAVPAGRRESSSGRSPRGAQEGSLAELGARASQLQSQPLLVFLPCPWAPRALEAKD